MKTFAVPSQVQNFVCSIFRALFVQLLDSLLEFPPRGSFPILVMISVGTFIPEVQSRNLKFIQ